MTTPTFHGLLVLDKPSGMTSRATVDRAQRWFPRRTRLGHTGTLDPLATGVLVLCVGAATRLTEYVQRMAKTYHAGITLGARSDTDDADGQITPVAAAVAPDAERVTLALGSFLGTSAQVPPAYSAAHVAGQRAYDLARRGEAVALTARPVTIHAIDVVRYDYPHLELTVHCGKGTYIRALARDLGERLGCGGFIQSLRRTHVGCFDATQALPLDSDAATARSRLLPIEQAVAELPRVVLNADDAARFRQGQSVPLPMSACADGQSIAVFCGAGRLLAVGVSEERAGVLRPEKVIALS